MSTFNSIDSTFAKPYLNAILDVLQNNEPLKFTDGTSQVVNHTPEIKKLIKSIEDRDEQAINKVIKPTSAFAPIFNGWKWSNIEKSQFSLAGGSKFNRGDVSEGILAAAITARFINKNKSISASDVVNILKKLRSADNKRVDQTFESVNENPAVVDDVRCHISLAEGNMKALLNSANYGGLSDLIQAAAEYANGSYISKWSKLMYENNVYNYIEVDSDGLLDQKGTKVDLRVKIDEQLTDVNISLKAGDVKQFGQVSGSKLENMAALFEPLGVNILNNSQLKTKFNEFLKSKDTVGSNTLVYEYVKTELSKPSKDILKSISNFIQWHATRNEENVTLVQLNKSQAKVYVFDQLQAALADVDLGVDIKYGTSAKAGKIPTLIFYDKNGSVAKDQLFTIRMKIDSRPDGFYHRNYVEKGSALTKRIA